MAQPKQQPKKHSKRLQFPRHWSKSDLLYLAMGISLIVWPIIEMSVRKDIDPNFMLVITLGVLVILINFFYFNKNRTNKSWGSCPPVS